MPACTLDSSRLGVFLHFDGVDVSYSVKTPPGCSRHGLTSSLTLLQNTTAGLWLPWLDEQLTLLQNTTQLQLPWLDDQLTTLLLLMCHCWKLLNSACCVKFYKQVKLNLTCWIFSFVSCQILCKKFSISPAEMFLFVLCPI